MQAFIEGFYRVNGAVSAFVWGLPMLALFLGTGIYFTICTRGLQLRRLGEILRSPFCRSREEGGLSAFSAVSGALAGTLGIGNIIGVAGALLLGGPGTVFWMVVSALLCMAVKFAETVLAMRYRTKNESGETVGGPMYYMQAGLGLPGMAAVFCLLCIASALFGTGNVTQIATAADAVESVFRIDGLWASAACVLLIAGMTGGSIKRLGRAFSLLTPLMSLAFMAAAFAVILKNPARLGPAFFSILRNACSFRAAAGGAGAYTMLTAMKYGIARGVFSNEAGMGSSPIIHAASGNTPVRQGMCGAFEVFFDTAVMAVLTALAILCSGASMDAKNGMELIVAAFSCVFGRYSGAALSLMLMVFAVSSVPCWYFYGERCVEYLTGRGRAHTDARAFRRAYRSAFFLLMFFCPRMRLEGLWQLADTLNGLMAVPNLIAVCMLSREVAGEAEEYWEKEGSRKRRLKIVSTR
ncbi:MAG: sodium:alanine symporter family protein [Provencibacterium sp.]|jgi:AGCS family alanine or glycine:cation symporter|nr:sodium:alanine symporter family protein [Provencibacterium sp.]